jgi:formylglycine-generating enzyme required for sulfatase activity
MEPETRYPGLDDFLAALRFEGIPVGAHELGWLQHAFRLAPALDRQSFKDLLACTLIKQASQREVFEALFEDWCPPDGADMAKPLADNNTPSPEPAVTAPQPRAPEPGKTAPEQEPPPEIPTPFWTAWRPWLFTLIGLMVAVLAYAVIRSATSGPAPPPKPHPPTTAFTVEPTPQPATADLPKDPAPHYWTWVPTFDPPGPPLISPAWLAFGLAGLALLAGALLSWRYRRRIDIPVPEASPDAGPAWLPLPKLTPTGPALLDPDALRAAVWGVERFVSDDETRAIDIDSTVAATARAGGLPTMRFEHAVYAREVWLWRDEMVQEPTIDRVLAELERSLTLAGLPVRLGTFTDTPTLIRWREGQEFSTLSLEGHRQSALVVVLTDGYGMQLAAASELEKSTLVNLLRAFGEWPRLTFVDCSYGAYGLAARVQAYGLRCIVPEDIPAFLGTGPVKPVAMRRTHQELLGDLRAWAAATALSPEPVDDTSAFALRARLGLELSPWDFRDLAMAAESSGDRLIWSPSRRAALLNWLTQCTQKDGQMADNSPLAQALEYWIARYQDASAQRQAQQNPLLPWTRTPAEQRLRLEIALLELWRRPAEATRMLYRLRRALGNEIRERLARLVDWDSRKQAQRDVLYMPWRFADLPAQVQVMLTGLGFGSSMAKPIGELRMPVSLSLALGVCIGLTAVAIGTGVWRLMTPATPVLRPLLPAPFRGVMLQDLQRSSAETYRLALGTPKRLRVETVPAHNVIHVTWTWQEESNVKSFGRSELWHAGTLPQAIRGCESNWPRRSLVVIQAEPGDVPARQLAIQLLDRGSADAVLLGTDWAEHLKELIQVDASMTTQDQLLLILPPDTPVPGLAFQGAYGVVESRDLHTLATRLDFAGVLKLSTVWGEARADSPLLLRGGPEKTSEQTSRPGIDITFVTVCGGTFTMGSNDFDWEKPPHPVTLSTFEISQTEITEAQYRASLERGTGGTSLPAVHVTWHNAKAFCEKSGYALPTEAEWEYAARAGSITPWSFGSDEKQLGNYAWYSDNSEDRAHPVGQKLPNPLGLYDMHGNVWEWAEDCFDENAYNNRPGLLVDPVVGGSCKYRVLRGGSAWDGVPRDLRSADRRWVGPEGRLDVVGFRCVRRPRRQP